MMNRTVIMAEMSFDCCFKPCDSTHDLLGYADL